MVDDSSNSTFGGVLVAGVIAASLITGAIVTVMQADAGQPRALDGGPLHRVELAPENPQMFNEALATAGFPTGPVSLNDGRAVCHDMLGTLENDLNPKFGSKRAVDFVNLSHTYLCKITKVDGVLVQ